MYKIVIIFILSLCALAAPSKAQTPLIQESFEASTALPADWQFQAWQADISSAKIDSSTDGQHSLHISSRQPNHAYLKKTIALTPQHFYLLQARIKARGANAGALAAVLGVDGNADASETVRSDEQWQTRQVYLAAGDANSVTVLLGLGHFANNNQGEAWFDDVSLTMVDAIPAGSKVLQLSAPAPAATAITPPAASPWLKLVAGLLILAVLSVALAWHLKRADTAAGQH